MYSELIRRYLLTFGPIGLWTFCGSTLGSRIGLHGFDQWPVVGFAVGLVLTSTFGVWPLSKKVRELQSRIESIEQQ